MGCAPTAAYEVDLPSIIMRITGQTPSTNRLGSVVMAVPVKPGSTDGHGGDRVIRFVEG